MEKPGFSFCSVFAAFAAGATAGTIAALLLAPRSGAETRKRLNVIPRAVKAAYTQALEAGNEAFSESYASQTAKGAASKHH